MAHIHGSDFIFGINNTDDYASRLNPRWFHSNLSFDTTMDWGQTISRKYRKHHIDFYDRWTHKFVIKYRVLSSLFICILYFSISLSLRLFFTTKLYYLFLIGWRLICDCVVSWDFRNFHMYVSLFFFLPSFFPPKYITFERRNEVAVASYYDLAGATFDNVPTHNTPRALVSELRFQSRR